MIYIPARGGVRFLRRIAPAASLCLTFSCFGFTAPAAHADSPARRVSNFASDSGNILYLAAAVGLPLLSDGGNGRSHALRVADSIGTSVILSEGLKNLFHERRPDSNAHDSFPSGHATAAFAAATAEGSLHPKQALLWHLGAALISCSRVRLHRHYERDVVAGALIGYGTARLEMSAPRGLVLSPVIEPDGRSYGLQVSTSWR